MYVGKKVTRVDAHDKVIGRTRYTDDLCDKSAYIARILHSTIAHGRVVSMPVFDGLGQVEPVDDEVYVPEVGGAVHLFRHVQLVAVFVTVFRSVVHHHVEHHQ